MKACVLIAAAAGRAELLAETMRGFETLLATDETRADVLAAIGCFQAIIVDAEFLPRLTQAEVVDSPLIRLDSTIALPDLPTIVAAAIRRGHDDDARRAGEHEPLSSLSYSAYVDLVRYRATRRYLLGLMRRHQGSVTDASATAGVARESLHRQLRRHDVDPDAFRDTDDR
ncbi:MAG TPA: hypothetical protein VHE35_07435 [Kofleriaceae bacterium]|nr:hypothetical protein [Kofleriaceae bacterium]